MFYLFVNVVNKYQNSDLLIVVGPVDRLLPLQEFLGTVDDT